MTNFPLLVIGFENKFHAVGCLIKGPHFVPKTTSLSFLNLTKIWPKKYLFCPFLGYFPIAPLCHTDTRFTLTEYQYYCSATVPVVLLYGDLPYTCTNLMYYGYIYTVAY